MKIFRYLLTFLFGVALTIAMLRLDLPIWFIYICVVILLLLIMVATQIYIVYKSNNIKRIEQYLEKNKRKPIFAYPLAVKTGDSDKIMESIQTILDKHKQSYIQEVYKTNLALYENNVSKIEQLARQISKEPLRTYYMAYAEALKGNFEETRALKKSLPVLWMQHAIEAIIAKEQRDLNRFREEADAGVAHARGIQKFNLLYSFQHMERNSL
ncbi:hypothetical protein [Psychrobacillus vulpis]|uniref:Uncharacterized protein n=1 Tax=Psychrobacillus vulpis TaxID=2325572 RepID=A0A544TTP4_9BACI|nr:hypothetical protein [Psychrobacillus vulpis]TQR20805.1 hypothetical protein FG384_04210 [Psychrobacillus vulpis]